MKASAGAFAAGLKAVKAAAKKTAVRATSMVLVRDIGDDAITLECTDCYGLWIRATVAGEPHHRPLLVDHAALLRWVSSMPADAEITALSTPEEGATWCCGSSRLQLSELDAELWPDAPEQPRGPVISGDAGDLSALVGAVAHCTMRDSSMAIGRVQLSVDSDGHLVASAMDGHRMAVAVSEITGPEMDPITIDPRHLAIVGEGALVIMAGGSWDYYAGESVVVWGRRCDAAFPDTTKVGVEIPDDGCWVDSERLLAALARCEPATVGGDKPHPATTTLDCTDSELCISVVGSWMTVTESLDAEGELEAPKGVGLNARYLADAVRACGSGLVRIAVDDKKIWHVVPGDDCPWPSLRQVIGGKMV